MLTAVVLILGALAGWLAVDQLLLSRNERRQNADTSWHGRGPGATFHSTGFEDTVPPHEVVQLPARAGRRST